MLPQKEHLPKQTAALLDFQIANSNTLSSNTKYSPKKAVKKFFVSYLSSVLPPFTNSGLLNEVQLYSPPIASSFNAFGFYNLSPVKYPLLRRSANKIPNPEIGTGNVVKPHSYCKNKWPRNPIYLKFCAHIMATEVHFLTSDSLSKRPNLSSDNLQ